MLLSVEELGAEQHCAPNVVAALVAPVGLAPAAACGQREGLVVAEAAAAGERRVRRSTGRWKGVLAAA